MANTQTPLANGGVDTHHHIFEPSKFAYSPDRHLTPPAATVQQFQEFKKAQGLTKSVLVHGLSYGHDCSSLKHFLKELGPETTRGVAVVDLSTPESEMQEMHELGVRGIRLDMYKHNAMLDVEKQIWMLRSYADKVQHFGWSLAMLPLNPENWARLAPVIRTLPVPVVTDHHALLKGTSMLPEGMDVLSQPGLEPILELLRSGNFWIKLSAPYRSSDQAPHYDDMKLLVQTLVETNPKRVLWGSDW
ncbi:2-pyrone-4 [Lasiodiplodia hormozganensis]|uniref:2-pyrone-4 n=1 Tax=Lasiodiplodia hormozganensis TaxID=869390 RepID=A0AA40CTJ0_9PEZI|nr:2-pyrone-4 [Lasiodiplodia hormozganensis]